MSVASRQYKGILKHYLRGLMAQLSQPKRSLSLLFMNCVGFWWGLEASRRLDATGWPGDPAAARQFAELCFLTFCSVFVSFILLDLQLLFTRNQRSEMLSLSAWPIPSSGLALTKILDCHNIFLLFAAFCFPSVIRSFHDAVATNTIPVHLAGFMVFSSHAAAGFFSTFIVSVLAGRIYSRSLGGRIGFTLFVVLWTSATLAIAVLLYLLVTSGSGSIYIEALARILVWDGPGRWMVIGGSLLVMVALLFAAIRSIGAWYVEEIESLDSAISRSEIQGRAAQGEPRLFRLPFVPQRIQAIWLKDLKILANRPLVFVTALLSSVIGLLAAGPALRGSRILDLSLDWITGILAAVGPMLAMSAYFLSMAIEGKGSERLSPYPIPPGQIFLAKTLLGLTLNLPLGIALAALRLSDGAVLLDLLWLGLWVAWLFPVIGAYLLSGSIERPAVSPGATDQQVAFASVISLPIFTLLLIPFEVLTIGSRFFPPLAFVGVLLLLGLYALELFLAVQVFRVVPA